MQAVRGSPIEKISGPRRPFRFAEIGRFTFVEVSAEVAPEIRARVDGAQELPRARAVEARIVISQVWREAWIVLLQLGRKLCERAADVAAGKRLLCGPRRSHLRKPRHQTLQRVLRQLPVGRD